MLRKEATELFELRAVEPSCWKKPYSFCPALIFHAKMFENLSTSPSEFIMSENKMSLIILVALAAHHNPNLISCKGKSYVSLVLSAYQYLLFLVFT
jgi:hypothetical protein